VEHPLRSSGRSAACICAELERELSARLGVLEIAGVGGAWLG